MRNINGQDNASIMFQVIDRLMIIAKNVNSPKRIDREIINAYEELVAKLKQIELSSTAKPLSQLFGWYYQWMMNKSGGGDFLNQVAIAYSLQGQYQQAIELYEKARQIYRNNRNRIGEADTLLNLGTVYLFLGQHKQAEHYYEQANNTATSLNDKNRQANILNNLGTIYFSEAQFKQERVYYEKAKSYYDRSLKLFPNLDKSFERAITLNLVGLVDCFLGQTEQGIENIKKSLDIHREQRHKNPVGEATSLNYLGVAYIFLGQYQQAIDYLQESLIIVRAIPSPPGEAFALATLGLAFFKQGNLIEAKRTLQDSIRIRENLRSELIDLNKVSFSDIQIDTYGLLQQISIEEGQPETALEISEQRRARALVELLGKKEFSLSGNELTTELIDGATSDAPQIDTIQQIARSQKSTIVEYSIIYDWFLDPVGIPRRGESKLLIWVIQPTGEIVFRSINLENFLKDKYHFSLEELVRKALVSIRVKEDRFDNFQPQYLLENKSIYNYLHQLYQILIQPIADLLPDNQHDPLIFIPQDSLFLITFSVLQDENGKFLIEKHTIVNASSIQVLSFNNKSTKKKVENPIDALVVGNPTMPINPLTEPPCPFEQLPESEEEAKEIASLFKTQAIIGDDATKIAIIEKMPKASLIHLATHGLINDRKRQLNSPGAIVLAASDRDNGLLNAGEIIEMKLQAELVVLSACRSGEGIITSDGVVGLSRSLLAAGVPSVIVSLWSVGDKSTRFLMTKFYQNLQQGMSGSTALRQAMLNTMQAFNSPKCWAGFALIGHHSPRLSGFDTTLSTVNCQLSTVNMPLTIETAPSETLIQIFADLLAREPSVFLHESTPQDLYESIDRLPDDPEAIAASLRTWCQERPSIRNIVEDSLSSRGPNKSVPASRPEDFNTLLKNKLRESFPEPTQQQSVSPESQPNSNQNQSDSKK